jgi:hypothetical protein
MYGRRRMPIARTALLVGVAGSAARNQTEKANLAYENERLREQARMEEANRQMQWQAQMQAAATEDAVRRGTQQAEMERNRSGQYNGENSPQNSGQVRQVINCERCKQVNQISNSFCTNCGLKLVP